MGRTRGADAHELIPETLNLDEPNAEILGAFQSSRRGAHPHFF